MTTTTQEMEFKERRGKKRHSLELCVTHRVDVGVAVCQCCDVRRATSKCNGASFGETVCKTGRERERKIAWKGTGGSGARRREKRDVTRRQLAAGRLGFKTLPSACTHDHLDSRRMLVLYG